MTQSEFDWMVFAVEQKVRLRINGILQNQKCKPSVRTTAFLWLMNAIDESIDDLKVEYRPSCLTRAITIREE